MARDRQNIAITYRDNSKYRSRFTDYNLKNELRCAVAQNIEPNFTNIDKKIVKHHTDYSFCEDERCRFV